MNKKYIDFVPAKRVEKGVPVKRAEVVTKKAVPAKLVEAPVRRATTVKRKVGTSARVVEIPTKKAKESALRTGRVHGVMYRAVPEQKTEEGLGVITSVGLVENSVENSGTEGVAQPSVSEKKVADKKDYQIPKSPFISQVEVKKRPLSKNVYQKEIKATEETDKGPVTIIAKPEKDSKAGAVIAIIIAIILGAATGTVAFLLLPK